jgi:hypothetical protein
VKEKRLTTGSTTKGPYGLKIACVPQDQGIRTEILDEAHNSKYAIHPGCTKMYQDLKDHFWWNDMRTDIAQSRQEIVFWSGLNRGS